MPPTIEAFFALLLAVPFYLHLYLSRIWNGAVGTAKKHRVRPPNQSGAARPRTRDCRGHPRPVQDRPDPRLAQTSAPTFP